MTSPTIGGRWPRAQPSARRIIAAEDVLARRARTVVCSDVLAQRWLEPLRHRGAGDPQWRRRGRDSLGAPTTIGLGAGPHAVYVGTLHANRLDASLVEALAAKWPGTVHLVGPDYLEPEVQARLDVLGVRRPGSIPSSDVPSWLVSADVLICPHRVDEFTLSLDAIKSHEYLATDCPIVATPSSGFQSLDAPGLVVAAGDDFVDAVISAPGAPVAERTVAVDWADRAAEFLATAVADGRKN